MKVVFHLSTSMKLTYPDMEAKAVQSILKAVDDGKDLTFLTLQNDEGTQMINMTQVVCMLVTPE